MRLGTGRSVGRHSQRREERGAVRVPTWGVQGVVRPEGRMPGAGGARAGASHPVTHTLSTMNAPSVKKQDPDFTKGKTS